ncbi:MAG: nitroreductase family protein [Nevskia sp.]|nr:nitroreductase family protein [Nevskia sp.]
MQTASAIEEPRAASPEPAAAQGPDDLACDFAAFAKVVRTRRSVRAYLPEPIPGEVLDACLDLALLAPTSHNLESWQFVVVQERDKLARLRHLCLDQPPALQAPTLIVAVARPDFWRLGRRLMLDAVAREPSAPRILLEKYRLQIPLIFADGPFHILAPLKLLAAWIVGLFRPTWYVDVGRAGQRLWATKTAALACQNLMLALRAADYDSCAMEGFDEPRVKRLLGLPRAAHVIMVIAAGRRAEGGVMPQFRFDRAYYVQTV